jgi:glycosyltransferase involved in cell wall biosynthesis
VAEPVRHRAAYVAFDRFPSTKGSAVHIAHMAGELFHRFDGGLLCVLGGDGLPRYQSGQGVEVVRFDEPIPNLLDRAEAFSAWVTGQLYPHRETLRLCHVRDPWSALPVLAGPVRSPTRPGRCRWVYEVNGLPSIELPHTWPQVSPTTLRKIRALEEHCLRQADAVVAPSAVIAEAITALGLPREAVHLVPNGADPPSPRPPRPSGAPGRYLVYVGALQPWQGLDVLLRAFARLADLTDLHLVICSSVRRDRARALHRLAARLEVTDRVRWLFTVPHAEVGAWLTHAELSVAPLTGCPRNLDQGCSPLKIWESMAAGTPVVASDLPPVREVLGDSDRGFLVRPDRPAELARRIRVLLEYPDLARAAADRARRFVVDAHTWHHTRSRLAAVYDQVTGVEPNVDLPGALRSPGAAR